MGPVIDLPDGVQAMAARGPDWAAWVDALPKLVQSQLDDWNLIAEGAPTHGYCSVVLPARTSNGVAAVLKIAFPDDESEHEHLARRRVAELQRTGIRPRRPVPGAAAHPGDVGAGPGLRGR